MNRCSYLGKLSNSFCKINFKENLLFHACIHTHQTFKTPNNVYDNQNFLDNGKRTTVEISCWPKKKILVDEKRLTQYLEDNRIVAAALMLPYWPTCASHVAMVDSSRSTGSLTSRGLAVRSPYFSVSERSFKLLRCSAGGLLGNNGKGSVNKYFSFILQKYKSQASSILGVSKLFW